MTSLKQVAQTGVTKNAPEVVVMAETGKRIDVRKALALKKGCHLVGICLYSLRTRPSRNESQKQ